MKTLLTIATLASLVFCGHAVIFSNHDALVYKMAPVRQEIQRAVSAAQRWRDCGIRTDWKGHC